MDLQPGDWVSTDTGLKGKIVHISRMSAFVEVDVTFQGGHQILPFLISELTKIDAPAEDPPATGDSG
jgi:hypothetical protein